MTKDAQNSISEGGPNRAKKGGSSPRDFQCSEFLTLEPESTALSQVSLPTLLSSEVTTRYV